LPIRRVTHPVHAQHTLAVGLVEADEAAVETDDGAHKIVAVCTVALLILLQALDFKVEGFLLCNLGRSEMKQLRGVLFALDFAS
jgi:hypothetical protein